MAAKKIIILLMLLNAASAIGVELKFDAVMNNKVIGQHTFITEEDKVISEADFHIEFLFMDIYYQHKSEESWMGDCLTAISSKTNDDGDLFVVNGNVVNKKLSVTANDEQFELPSCIMTFAYWNPKILEQDKLLNSQNGEYLEVNVKFLKREEIVVRGGKVLADCYELIAMKDEEEKINIQLWYDESNQWVALNSPTPIGDIFYKLH